MNSSRSVCLAGRASACVAVALACLAGPQVAGAKTWLGFNAGNSNWTAGLNWVGAAAPANDGSETITFRTEQYRSTSTVNQNYSIYELEFLQTDGPGNAYVINGDGWLNVGHRIENQMEFYAQTINANVAFTADGQVVNRFSNLDGGLISFNGVLQTLGHKISFSPSANSINVNGPIDGAGSIRANGPGLLMLNGSNNFTGGIEIYGGTVGFNSGPNLGPLSNFVAFRDDGTLMRYASGTTSTDVFINANVVGTLGVAGGAQATQAGRIAGLGSMNKGGDGTLRLTVAPEVYGSVGVGGGVLRYDVASTGTQNWQTLHCAAFGRFELANDRALRVPNLVGTGGQLVLAAGSQLTVEQGSYTGVFQGPGTLVKDSLGTLDFNDNGAISGDPHGDVTAHTGPTVVLRGRLNVNGNNGLGTGAVEVGTFGWLSSTGPVSLLGGPLEVRTGGLVDSLSVLGPVKLDEAARIGAEVNTTTRPLRARSVLGPGTGTIDLKSAILELRVASGFVPTFANVSQVPIVVADSGLTNRFASIRNLNIDASHRFAVTYGTSGAAGTAYVTYARIGDADLSGAVDFADLLRLAQHYDSSPNLPAAWADGDFNGDGVANFSDLLELAQHYGRTRTGSTAGDWALARSLAPEPATAGAAAIAASLALRTRTRSRPLTGASA